ncbi:MAG TPA: response regulator [Devosia sp.]
MTDEFSPLPILLLVEDEQALQSLLETALADEGFEVVMAGSGAKAIAELESHGADFKALITDIRLGSGPDGWEVGHRARQIVPGIPVVYMSGDSIHEWSAEGVPESIMLQKPFALAQLIAAVTSLMNAAISTAALGSAMAQDGKPKT